MRVIDVSAIVLAPWLIAGATVQRAAAEEPIDRPAAITAERLATQSDLDAVSLSIVDEKLATSLAVEMHIQIELTELALPGIRHDNLKQFAARKLRVYRQLLSNLEELTGGQTAKMLARASRKTQVSETNGDSPPPMDGNRVSPKPGRKGGIGDVVQNVTTQAILRVRLEIAGEYLQLLRAELSAAPPDGYDQRYLAIEAHNQMQVLAMLRVFEKQASPQFSRIIRPTTVAAESSVAEARQVSGQLQTAGQIIPTSSSQVVDAAKTGGS